MLTPLSSTALPLLEFPTTNKTPVTSPPTSGLGTPTDGPPTKPLKEAASSDTTSSSQEKGAMGESPLPPYGGQLKSKTDHLKPSGAFSDHSTHGGDGGLSSIVTATTLPQHFSQLKPPPVVLSSQSPHSYSHHTSSLLSSSSISVTGSSSGSHLMQHHRPLITQPTVVASPLKPSLHSLSAETKRELEKRGEQGTFSGAPLPKRTRLSRRNTSSGEDEHSKY